MIQWLRLRAPNARHVGLISGQGTKVPPAAAKKIKKSCLLKKKKEKVVGHYQRLWNATDWNPEEEMVVSGSVSGEAK